MKTKIFKGLAIFTFQIGVNIIGLPLFHTHEIKYFKTISK